MIKLLFVAALIAGIWWMLKPKAKSAPRLNDTQARDILGVSTDATADDIRAAHRRLLGGVHPDRGGSAELTRQINTARDLLLRRLKA